MSYLKSGFVAPFRSTTRRVFEPCSPIRTPLTVVAPAEAFFHETLGEFLLPYDAVRRAADPEAMLMAFLGSTYRAAADAGQWDSAALECLLGVPGVPRSLAR